MTRAATRTGQQRNMNGRLWTKRTRKQPGRRSRRLLLLLPACCGYRRFVAVVVALVCSQSVHDESLALKTTPSTRYVPQTLVQYLAFVIRQPPLTVTVHILLMVVLAVVRSRQSSTSPRDSDNGSPVLPVILKGPVPRVSAG